MIYWQTVAQFWMWKWGCLSFSSISFSFWNLSFTLLLIVNSGKGCANFVHVIQFKIRDWTSFGSNLIFFFKVQIPNLLKSQFQMHCIAIAKECTFHIFRFGQPVCNKYHSQYFPIKIHHCPEQTQMYHCMRLVQKSIPTCSTSIE